MMRTEWESGGNIVFVETEKQEDETDADQAIRHHGDVLAKLQNFPID